MAKWHPMYVKARNIKTGKTVKIPISSRDEVNSLRWYPSSDYVPLKIGKKR